MTVPPSARSDVILVDRAMLEELQRRAAAAGPVRHPVSAADNLRIARAVQRGALSAAGAQRIHASAERGEDIAYVDSLASVQSPGEQRSWQATASGQPGQTAQDDADYHALFDPLLPKGPERDAYIAASDAAAGLTADEALHQRLFGTSWQRRGHG